MSNSGLTAISRAIFLCCLSIPAWPQTGPGPRITLDVVVSGKNGKPVPALEQQDFTLLDNKQPQKLLSFQAVEGASASEPVEIILLLDEVNANFQTAANERDQIKKFLRQNGGQLAQPVSMIFFNDAGAKTQKATRDGNALIAAIDQNKTALRSSRPSQGIYGAEDRVQMSLQELNSIAADEQNKPGKKMLIWLSPGWAMLSGPRIDLTKKDHESVFGAIIQASTELIQARITLYSIDPAGAVEAGGLRTTYYQEFLKAVRAPGQSQPGNLSLEVLAEQSGGRVLNSSNDIAGEIASCAADATAYYVLTFAPPVADGPNEYHALDIRLDKPGLKARTRAGYYDQP
jgi:VWFA-related protein